MLIGNRESFAIELSPLSPSRSQRYLPERSAWATFALWVNGYNLCRNVREGEEQVRAGVNVPLAPVADWVVRVWPFLAFEERPRFFPPRPSPMNTVSRWGDAAPPVGIDGDAWLDLREEWWSRHFLQASDSGSHLPNVVFLRSSKWLVVEWSHASLAGESAPEFLTLPRQFNVLWEDAEEVFRRFVDQVAKWLSEDGLGDLYPWVEQGRPLEMTALEHALEAYTGRSIEDLIRLSAAGSPQDLARALGLRDESRDPGGSVMAQALRDLPPRLAQGIDEQLRMLGDYTSRTHPFPPDIRERAQDAANAATSPEEAGYNAAREMRRSLRLDGQPIGAMEEQLERLSVEVADGVECALERMLVGARRDGAAWTVVNTTPRTSVPWSRRFELARALGYLVVAPYREGALGGASSPFSQPWLRRGSGAFAAEFLLPTEAVSARGLDGLDRAAEPPAFRDLMRTFQVGARTAAYQLWNHGFLSSTQVRDELIDRFASEPGPA